MWCSTSHAMCLSWRPTAGLGPPRSHDRSRALHPQVVDGSLRRGDRIVSSATKEAYDAQEIGVLTPKMVPW